MRGDNSFVTQQRGRAAAWKASTVALPAEARVDAAYINQDGQEGADKYPFCLPAEFAELNLLPEVRASALALFVELGIPWHAGVGRGPGNHLLSSQVQCVNALGQMVSNEERIRRSFGKHLGTVELLKVEPGRFLTFEYIGPTDYFQEGTGGARTRGAHCTSVDAAFLHRTLDDAIELVLVEWKYTESYRRRSPEPRKDATRKTRYWNSLNAPDSPVCSDLLSFEALCDEPLYQLMRQQLLAKQLERDHVLGADRVVVVHVLPSENDEYQASLHRAEQRALGATVMEAWSKLLRAPDRFGSLDSALFCDPEITSPEYVARYDTSAVQS